MRILNPDNITAPASNYSQGVEIDSQTKRVIVSGQCGVTPAGELLKGTEAQMRQAFSNVIAVVEAGGLSVSNIIKVTVFLTSTDDIGLYRTVRDEMFDGHTCASTLLVVAALAHPQWTVEIEAEATA